MVNLLIQNFELIFISMNNHALKLVKEKGSISFKVQDLIKMPEDEFTNLGKQSLYENSKAYHKKQKGILRSADRYGQAGDKGVRVWNITDCMPI